MSIISYRIRSKREIAHDMPQGHPIHNTYRQPNQAWAALRQHYKLTNEELKRDGWQVKLDVDETTLAVEALDVAIDVAPVPNLMRRVLSKVFGRKG
jgi:hypothetical protein